MPESPDFAQIARRLLDHLPDTFLTRGSDGDEAIPDIVAQLRQVWNARGVIEPESVTHWVCPQGVDGEAPTMTLTHTRNDDVGRQRRYVCPRCAMEITVDFPPDR